MIRPRCASTKRRFLKLILFCLWFDAVLYKLGGVYATQTTPDEKQLFTPRQHAQAKDLSHKKATLPCPGLAITAFKKCSKKTYGLSFWCQSVIVKIMQRGAGSGDTSCTSFFLPDRGVDSCGGSPTELAVMQRSPKVPLFHHNHCAVESQGQQYPC